MVYVPAPHRSSDGLTLVPLASEFTGRGYYPTAGEAFANRLNISASASPGWSAGTYCSGMSNGRVGPGQFVDTFLHGVYIVNRREQDYVHVHKVSPTQFYVERRTLDFGFTGFYDCGCGNPATQFEPYGPNGFPAAIANRAIMENLVRRAEVECLQKARDQKLDLSESLVDLDKSIIMIGRRAKQVISAFRHARAGRFYEAAAALGVARPQTLKRRVFGNIEASAQYWLELYYGWIPLLTDIFNGVQVVNEGLSRPESTLIVTRRLTEGLPFVNLEVGEWADQEISHNAECGVETKYRFRVSNANLAYLTSLGIENPAYIAWVALPMSFVIDWLVPVSDWLNALTAPLGLTFISGYTSLRTSGRVEIKRHRKFNGDFPILQSGRATQDFVHFHRTVHGSFPVPKLYFRFPFTSIERVASATALFITQAKGPSIHRRG